MENLFIAQAYTSEGVVENGCPSFVMPLTIKRLARRHLWHMTRNLVNNLKVPKLWVADRREPGRSNINHCQTLGKELLFWNDEYSSRWCKLVQTCSWLCDNKWNTMELCGAWFDSELCYCFSVLLRSVYILPKRLLSKQYVHRGVVSCLIPGAQKSVTFWAALEVGNTWNILVSQFSEHFGDQSLAQISMPWYIEDGPGFQLFASLLVWNRLFRSCPFFGHAYRICLTISLYLICFHKNPWLHEGNRCK